MIYALFRPTAEKGATEAALTAFLDLLFEERGFEPMASSQESCQSIRAEWFEHLKCHQSSGVKRQSCWLRGAM